ncbi:uncharacterized protein NPIL_467691 [Nephila pilipes]|uniref:Uncharacterized protein n=1 Tax=Nephila pilipes TaxID=299642 RepID=A0A8X6MWD3_NEPPI|nr:uncharacterized protein NPIL_467691 [Nephila pilipes]
MDAQECQWVNYEQLFMSQKKMFCMLLNMAFWKLPEVPLGMCDMVMNTQRWKEFVQAELLFWHKTRKQGKAKKVLLLVEKGIKYTFCMNNHIKRVRGRIARPPPKKKQKILQDVKASRMAVYALIHTTGVVLDKQYIPLELSYVDVTGYEIYFHLKSPYSYDETIQQFPHARPDVIMTTKHGTPLANVLHFLQVRYHQLQEQFPNTIIVFGCKGNSYQMQVLRQTGLPHLSLLARIM